MLTIGGVTLADVRDFMAAVERRPTLLNNHQDVREWIDRMHGLLGERPGGKRARTALAPPSAAAAAPMAAPPPPVQSRIPVPTWTSASASMIAPLPAGQGAPSSAPSATPRPPAAATKPLPVLAVGGAAVAAAIHAVTPTHKALAVSPSPAILLYAPRSTARGAGTPAPGVLSRVPLGLSPMLNFGAAVTPLLRAQPIFGSAAKPDASLSLSSTCAPAEDAGRDTPMGDADPTPSESTLDVTPSMASPTKSTRRLRPRVRNGARAPGDVSPSLSTPSFLESPPKSTRRIHPPRARASLGGALSVRKQTPMELAADSTPSLPATPRFSLSPPKSTKCKRQQRGSLGWSDASSPPPIPSFDASPPKTVRQTANPSPLRPNPTSPSEQSVDLLLDLADETDSDLAQLGRLDDTLAAADFLGVAPLPSEQRQWQGNGQSINGVRTDGFSLSHPPDMPLSRRLASPPTPSPSVAPALSRAATLADEGTAHAEGAAAATLAAKLPDLDLERFPRMFRQPHSEGATRLREVYKVLREFNGPLSAADVQESLPTADNTSAQLVAFLLDLLTSRAYLYTQLEGDIKCWRAV
ncbi:hypothetical protein T492DRAFT_1023458 [Pavlovales sp. CCMP2436]|nr:hypothetical protein T492DRAFT_1023458 [Pavlovales sp. CCMP2436]